jgi:hypothetical protein
MGRHVTRLWLTVLWLPLAGAGVIVGWMPGYPDPGPAAVEVAAPLDSKASTDHYH